jgi:hypothetical protein
MILTACVPEPLSEMGIRCGVWNTREMHGEFEFFFRSEAYMEH